MPFEEAPFGVTGLETAFAALYTQLVEPGVAAAGDAARADVRRAGARIYGLDAPRIAVGAPANLVLLDLDADVARRRGQLPLEVGQLVAARHDAHGPRRRPSPPAGWSSTRHERLPGPRGRHDLPRRSVGAPGVAFGEAVFTTAMTGYQEIVTDPSFAEQLVVLHGADGRQLRRLAASAPSRRGRTRARCSCGEAAGQDWTRWLAEPGIVALEEIDTRALVAPPARARARCAAAAVAGDASVDEVLADVRAQAADGGPGARRRRLDAGAVPRRRAGASASPSSTTAASARSSAASLPPAPR